MPLGSITSREVEPTMLCVLCRIVLYKVPRVSPGFQEPPGPQVSLEHRGLQALQWDAPRFVISNIEQFKYVTLSNGDGSNVLGRMIKGRMAGTVGKCM